MRWPGWTSSWATGILFVALYALGMPGYDVPLLSFAALVPLLVLSLEAETPPRAALRGFLAGTAANVLLFYWIAYTVAVPGRLGWGLGALCAILVSAYMGTYIAAASFFINLLHRRFGAAGFWAFPFVWTGLEYVRSVAFTGFPWLLLGYSLSGRTLLLQAADLAGVFGLGFLLALSSVCLYFSGSRLARREYRPALPPLVGFAAIVVSLVSYGSYKLGGEAGSPPPRSFRVGIAQGGIDQSRKWDPSFQQRTLEIYESLTRQARISGAQVVVWPETAAPFFYGWETDLSRTVDRIASENVLPLIFGAPWFSPSEGGKYYNSVFLLDPRGVPAGRYDKRRLVPFGEYVPLRGVLSFVRKLTEGGEDFSAGTGPALFTFAGETAGASICYEAVFPGIIRESVLSGAQWLVNVTNDAWFGDTVAPHQHLAMARMRSVEFRRPLVRAANTGISALIDPRGRVAASLGLFRQGTLVGEVTPREEKTLYAKTGDIFAKSCIIITVLLLFILLRGVDGIRTVRRKIRRP